MYNIWIAASIMALAISPDIGGGLAKRAAREVVGHVAQEALEDALKDAALNASLDAFADEYPADVTFGPPEFDHYMGVGADVSDGVEAAMRAADIAEKLDNVADAAKVVKKLGKLRKLKR